MNQTNASKPQPHPTPGGRQVLEAVMDDFRERADSGREKYGTYLEAFNGRDPLWDAYQEAIDLAMYLRQAIMERDLKQGTFPQVPPPPKSNVSLPTLPPSIWDLPDPNFTHLTLLVMIVVMGIIGFIIGAVGG